MSRYSCSEQELSSSEKLNPSDSNRKLDKKMTKFDLIMKKRSVDAKLEKAKLELEIKQTELKLVEIKKEIMEYDQKLRSKSEWNPIHFPTFTCVIRQLHCMLDDIVVVYPILKEKQICQDAFHD